MSPETQAPHLADEEGSTLSAVLHKVHEYYSKEDSNNPTLAICAEAMQIAMNIYSFNELIQKAYNVRRNSDLHVDHRYMFNLVARATAADLLQRDIEPYELSTPEEFVHNWTDILDDDERTNEFTRHLMTEEIQSNIEQRSCSTKLLASAFENRWGPKPNVLNIGSSRKHGDIALLFGHENGIDGLGFLPIELGTQTRGGKLITNHKLTELANEKLKQETEFGEMVAVDIVNIDDPKKRFWAYVCSLYFDERRNAEKVERYQLMDSIDTDHERIAFFRGDFTANQDMHRFRETFHDTKFDIIRFETVMYMYKNTPYKQLSMLINAVQLLSPNGVIIVQDAADGNFQKKFNYVTSVLDANNIEAGLQDVLRWETARCRSAKLEPGLLSINGIERTLRQALERKKT